MNQVCDLCCFSDCNGLDLDQELQPGGEFTCTCLLLSLVGQLHPGFWSTGLRGMDHPALMQYWFQLVQQKSSLLRFESELVIL